MKRHLHILMTIAALTAWGGHLGAQNSPSLPIVLTQKLPTEITSVSVGNEFDINVVYDTANYVAVVTSGTFEEAGSMSFPAGKLKLYNEGKSLTFSKEFPYTSRIQLHTTARNLKVYATDNAKVALSGSGNDTVHLETLVLNAKGNAIISVTSPVNADEVYLEVNDYGWIRYQNFASGMINKKINGSGRVMKFGEKAEDSHLPPLLSRDFQEEPYFLEWSFGTAGISTSPFGNLNAPTDNFIWSVSPLASFGVDFRFAFWQKPHWSFSTGIGMSVQSFWADNAYVDLVTDAIGATALQAIDASALLAREEMRNGPILWSSHFTTSRVYIPLRIEWRFRPDYKGFRLGVELQPGITIGRKGIYLIRNGFYTDKDQVASTRNERLGKYTNPLNLGLRLMASYGRVGIFAESLLTPLFRTDTDQPDSKPALNQKLYPVTLGISLTL